MALDARVRYTKMMIQNSFITLVKEKPFSKITLKEVCALAGINHSTFYRYYKDIFDWKEQFEASCCERTETLIVASNLSNIRSILTAMLEEFYANRELYTMMSSRNFESSILQQLCAIAINDAETKLRDEILSPPKGQRKWNCYYAVYGVEGIIQCWVNDGMIEPVNEMVDYIIAKLSSCFDT